MSHREKEDSKDAMWGLLDFSVQRRCWCPYILVQINSAHAQFLKE